MTQPPLIFRALTPITFQRPKPSMDTPEDTALLCEWAVPILLSTMTLENVLTLLGCLMTEMQVRGMLSTSVRKFQQHKYFTLTQALRNMKILARAKNHTHTGCSRVERPTASVSVSTGPREYVDSPEVSC